MTLGWFSTMLGLRSDLDMFLSILLPTASSCISGRENYFFITEDKLSRVHDVVLSRYPFAFEGVPLGEQANADIHV